MISFPPIPRTLGLLLLAAVLLGSAPAHAQLKAKGASRPAPAFCADLPPTLSALRARLFSPTERSPRPEPRDRWVARDKARHVVFSGLWTLSTQYVLVNKASWSEADALPAAITSGATIGLLKELYDASHRMGRASPKDLGANAVGISLAVGVIVL